MFRQITAILIAVSFSLSAHAVSVDFTDASWKAAVGTGQTSASVGNVTISTSKSWHYLSFNSSNSETSGCKSGSSLHDLACLGDGIGIQKGTRTNDEISYGEQLLIEFAEAVDVAKIYLLDLFGAEKSGEKAIVINSNNVNKTVTGAVDENGNSIAGGFFTVEYTAIEGKGLTSILLKGYRDCFSDYALAGLEVTPAAVPLPGAAFLFGSALLGFFGFKRRRIA